MSERSDFDSVVYGQFVPDGAWEAMSFDTRFEHLNPYGRLAFLAVNIEMDQRGATEVASGLEREIFNKQHPDKDPGLVQRRWKVFDCFYQAVKERLEDPEWDPTDVTVFISGRPMSVKYPGVEAKPVALYNWALWKAARQQFDYIDTSSIDQKGQEDLRSLVNEVFVSYSIEEASSFRALLED